MERVRRVFGIQRAQHYEPLEGGSVDNEDAPIEHGKQTDFSWVEYYIFLLLGISMLWAWNMFLAAAPYFQARFATSDWLLTHFQSAIISVSTITNLVSMIVLTKLQRNASYTKRIIASLVINIICFTLLAISTTLFRNISANDYFAFLMVMVFAASLATGLCQNGLFAFVTGFGVSEYTQGIMTGQAVAGVLPCVAQIVSVLSVPAREVEDGTAQESPTSAFAYFLTATAVSALALLAFLHLARKHKDDKIAKQSLDSVEIAEDEAHLERKVVGMWSLFLKLRYLALAVFCTFAVTMLFPVFTQEILSTHTPEHTTSRIFHPTVFIPLAFLLWNVGDLFGRLITAVPQFSLIQRPRTVFLLSLSRLVFIPLYLLCNIKGRGAVVASDAFYLFVVQFLFGASNGYVGSTSMMGAANWVEVEEREAAGGFMGLMLVGGLTAGSLLSFTVAKA